MKYLYIRASDKKDAAKRIRYAPRVKHDYRDAIREVIEISLEQYLIGCKSMNEDLFFQVHNSSDQRLYNVVSIDEIKREEEKIKFKKNRNIQKIRNIINDKETKKILQGGYYE